MNNMCLWPSQKLSNIFLQYSSMKNIPLRWQDRSSMEPIVIVWQLTIVPDYVTVTALTRQQRFSSRCYRKKHLPKSSTSLQASRRESPRQRSLHGWPHIWRAVSSKVVTLHWDFHKFSRFDNCLHVLTCLMHLVVAVLSNIRFQSQLAV